MSCIRDAHAAALESRAHLLCLLPYYCCAVDPREWRAVTCSNWSWEWPLRRPHTQDSSHLELQCHFPFSLSAYSMTKTSSTALNYTCGSAHNHRHKGVFVLLLQGHSCFLSSDTFYRCSKPHVDLSTRNYKRTLLVYCALTPPSCPRAQSRAHRPLAAFQPRARVPS